jgi:hypothetical protein
MLAARACESELALTAPAIDIGLVRGLSNGRGADVGPATQKTPFFCWFILIPSAHSRSEHIPSPLPKLTSGVQQIVYICYASVKNIYILERSSNFQKLKKKVSQSSLSPACFQQSNIYAKDKVDD